MDMKNRGYALAVVGLGSLAMVGSARARQQPGFERPGAVVQAGQDAAGARPSQPAAEPARGMSSEPRSRSGRSVGGFQEVTDAAKVAFKLADQNNDGLISKPEAVDAGNLAIGGFFFRADTNGDGVLSKPEIVAARESVLRQRPLLRYILEKAGAEDARNQGQVYATVQELFSTIDSNGDHQVQAAEIHQMVEATVDGLYASADTNRDSQLSPVEINAAMIGMARAGADGVFKAADTDHNGAVSKDEYAKAIVAPANMLFVVIDKNGDNQITPEEAKAAAKALANELNRMAVAEPANSIGNLIRTGRAPDEVAPVPSFTKPAVNPGQAAPAAPAAPAQPR